MPGSTPLKSPAFGPSASAMLGKAQRLMATISGEFTASKNGMILGVAPFTGRVKAVNIGLNNCGRDDSNPLNSAVDVKVNGTTIFSTKPSIDRNNGSAGTKKSTFGGETGVTQPVFTVVRPPVSAGDTLTCDVTVTRTASPTTEMNGLSVFVDLEG